MMSRSRVVAAGLLAGLWAGLAFGHGNVTPQAVDTTGLKDLPDEWLMENPYGPDNERAVDIGARAYNQNCARCHGLDAVSGGIAPDLRYLPPGWEGDEWFVDRVRNGVVRNGMTYMPQFDEVLSQEALWAIRSYLEANHAQE